MFAGRDTQALVRAAARSGVRDQRVLAAVGAVDRRHFVPHGARPYRDRPIPTTHRQTTTQPSLVAAMLQALQLSGGERVLEVGTGLGYQAALLSRLVPQVWTVERFEDLAERARANLAAAGITGVTVMRGDGTAGLAAQAPFDAIVVAAAAPTVPAPLHEQLAEGGRLVMPIGPGGNDLVTVFARRHGDLVRDGTVTWAVFVPLVGAHAGA